MGEGGGRGLVDVGKSGFNIMKVFLHGVGNSANC